MSVFKRTALGHCARNWHRQGVDWPTPLLAEVFLRMMSKSGEFFTGRVQEVGRVWSLTYILMFDRSELFVILLMLYSDG